MLCWQIGNATPPYRSYREQLIWIYHRRFELPLSEVWFSGPAGARSTSNQNILIARSTHSQLQQCNGCNHDDATIVCRSEHLLDVTSPKYISELSTFQQRTWHFIAKCHGQRVYGSSSRWNEFVVELPWCSTTSWVGVCCSVWTAKTTQRVDQTATETRTQSLTCSAFHYRWWSVTPNLINDYTNM